MVQNVANISIKNGQEVIRTQAEKVLFSSHCCFAYDNGKEDKACLDALGNHLLGFNDDFALTGPSVFLDYLLGAVPELAKKAKYVVDESCFPGKTEHHGIPALPPQLLPDSICAVFVCETKAFPIGEIGKKLSPQLQILGPEILPDIAEEIIPFRSWVNKVDSIYPVSIPRIEFKENQDLVLLDCPSRNMALMPNGLAYVHNAIRQTGIKFQTMDLDIITYHRFHTHRLFDTGGIITTDSGLEFPKDPWLAENDSLWQNTQTIDYFRPEIDETIDALVKAKPKILGLSINACNLKFSREIVNGVKEALPDTIILVGGFSCYQPDVGLKAFPECDYMVIGEADLTVGPLVKKLARGESPKNMPGVMSRWDSSSTSFVPGPMPENLDELEMPRYEWFDLDIYRNHDHYQLTPVIASRGCRWSLCTFCAERFHWRVRSVENVVDELQWLKEQGCDLFMWNESDLNGRPEILLQICDEIIRRDLNVKLVGQLRVHKKCDDNFYKKLRKAGFVSLRFGVDAWSRNTLRLQMKGYTLKHVTQNLKASFEAGIHTEVNTVVGVPGETEQDIQESIDFLIENKAYISRIANINPLIFAIGSVYWENPEKHNIQFREDRETLYRDYATTIPSNLWYSTEPYIDEHIRKERFEKVVRALYENGIGVGPYAEKVIHSVKEQGNGTNGKNQDSLEKNEISSEKNCYIPKESENIRQDDEQSMKTNKTQSGVSSSFKILKLQGEWYKVDTKGEKLLESISLNGKVKKHSAFYSDFVQLATGSFKLLSDPKKLTYLLGRAIWTWKNLGFRELMEKLSVRYKSCKNDYFVFNTSTSDKEKNS